MQQLPKELFERLPNGLPRVSRYTDFLQITKQADTMEAFVMWTQAAFTLIKLPAGTA